MKSRRPCDVHNRHRDRATELAVHSHGILVCARCPGVGIEKEVGLRIHHRYQACVSAGGRVEGRGCDWRLTRMVGSQFACQYALVYGPKLALSIVRPSEVSLVVTPRRGDQTFQV